MKSWRLITNGLLFQLAWFDVFLFHHNAHLVLPVILVTMLLLSGDPRSGLISLLNLPLALCIEWSAVALSLISYQTPTLPLWLVWLWCCLLTTLNSSLTCLSRIGSGQVLVLCLLFAPASYVGGETAGVLNITRPLWQFWPVFGLLWGSGFIAILMINKRLINVLGSERSVL